MPPVSVTAQSGLTGDLCYLSAFEEKAVTRTSGVIVDSGSSANTM